MADNRDQYSVVRILRKTHDSLRLLALLKDSSILSVVEQMTQAELEEAGVSAETLRQAMRDAQK